MQAALAVGKCAEVIVLFFFVCRRRNLSHRHVGCRRCTKLDNLINAMVTKALSHTAIWPKMNTKTRVAEEMVFETLTDGTFSRPFFSPNFAFRSCLHVWPPVPGTQTVGDDTRCFLHSHNVWWRLVMFLSSLQFFITRMQVLRECLDVCRAGN